MPRKGPAPRRELMPDPIYRSVVVTQVVNKILLSGKRSTAEHIVYSALKDIERKTGGEPVAVLKRAVENVRPVLEVKSRRVGGATYQVPVEVRPRRATTLAIRWLIGYSRQRREKTMSERLVRRVARREQRDRRVDQAQGRPPEDGGVEQGVRPLPLVVRETQTDENSSSDAGAGDGLAQSRIRLADTRSAPCRPGLAPGRTLFAEPTELRKRHAPRVPPRKDPQHRHHGPHRRGQDHDDRAHPLLHRPHLQDR